MFPGLCIIHGSRAKRSASHQGLTWKKGPSKMIIRKYKQTRNWAIYDRNGELIAVTLYKKGALEIVRRLSATVAI
jgi:hypothetical protein